MSGTQRDGTDAGGRHGEREREKRIDETVEESFPASDPPAHSGTTGPGMPDDE